MGPTSDPPTTAASTGPAVPTDDGPDRDRARRRDTDVARWVVLGVLLLAAAALADVHRLGGHPLGLVQPGQAGPAADLVRQDFPEAELPPGPGLDGQMAYAVARHAWSVDAPTEHLDRPRYRLQRPLLPYLAGTLHPRGGIGLVWVLFGVGLAGAAAGAWATGRLSVGWGGPAWVAAVYPVLPGVFMSVRVTTSDGLGVGLALLAVALAARQRTLLAVAAGTLAVLAKEPTWLILAGWALAHRTRRDAAVAVVPALVAGAWMVALRLLVPGAESLNGDIGLPLLGLVTAARDIWSEGRELWGLASTVAALALASVALVRGRLRHPLGWAVALNLAFLLVAGSNPLGTSFGGTRTALALTALSIIVIATPQARRPGPDPIPEAAATDPATAADLGTDAPSDGGRLVAQP